MLKRGDKAPLTGKDQNGNKIVDDLKGTRFIFTPRTIRRLYETVRSLRDSYDVFRKGIRVLGVSVDDEIASYHLKFDLPLDLIADTDKSIVEKSGAWAKRHVWRKYMGTFRKTFLIDEKGKIVKIFDKVKVSEHADEVLAAFGEK